jgi:hypothetical protein
LIATFARCQRRAWFSSTRAFASALREGENRARPSDMLGALINI